MRFKRRRDWKEGRSITEGRSSGGQIILKAKGEQAGADTFLVRIGRRGSRTLTGSRTDAEQALEALRTELENGTHVPAKNVLFGTYLMEDFLIWKRPAVKPKTYGEYVKIAENRALPVLGRYRLQDLTDKHLQDWVDGLWDAGLAPKTVREYFALVRAALARAVVLGVLHSNPAAQVDTRRRSEDWWQEDPDELGLAENEGIDRSRVWDQSEMEEFSLRADADHEMTRWVRLGVRAGLRPQEQCGLRWVDVDFDKSVVRVRGAVIEVDKERREEFGRWVYGGPKTWWRDVVLPEDAMAVLKAQHEYLQGLVAAGKLSKERMGFVFPTRRGPRAFQNPSNIKDRLRKFIIGRKDRKSANGIPGVRYIPPYGLRHTHATDLLRNGWAVFDVAKRLGTSITMVERHYGHLLPDMEGEAISKLTPLAGFGSTLEEHTEGSSESDSGVAVAA